MISLFTFSPSSMYTCGMEIQIAVAKINKYAVSESGDTLEVVERPTGGISVVLADGQTSGRGAKAVSQLVVRKVIGLIAEGVRDGAAARAASDALFADKSGKVTCTLNIALCLPGTIPRPCSFAAANRSTRIMRKAFPSELHAMCGP
jgi:hypothetical protein